MWGGLDIAGGKTIDLSAPGEGEDMAGILIYQDRESDGTATNKFTGTGNTILDGVIYAPSNHIDYGGNKGTATNICTKVIAKTVKFHGTPSLGNDCSGNSDIADIGVPSVRLVE